MHYTWHLGLVIIRPFSTTISHPYAIDKQEAAFWNDIWLNGLGEMLYVNNVDAKRLATFSAQEGIRFEGTSASEDTNGAVLGIGGGKDSIIAGELLKNLKDTGHWLRYGHRRTARSGWASSRNYGH